MFVFGGVSPKSCGHFWSQLGLSTLKTKAADLYLVVKMNLQLGVLPLAPTMVNEGLNM